MPAVHQSVVIEFFPPAVGSCCVSSACSIVSPIRISKCWEQSEAVLLFGPSYCQIYLFNGYPDPSLTEAKERYLTAYLGVDQSL